MKILCRKHLALFVAMTLALILIVPGVAFAETLVETGMSDFAAQAGLGGTSDVRLIVARIIRTVLSFAGVILVVMIIYGGVMWMLSGGVQEKITKARNTILNAVIGLVIVLAAFAITQFVISSLVSASSYSGSTSDDTGGPGIPSCPGCPIDYSGMFVAESWGCLESLETVPKNAQTQILFNRKVRTDTDYLKNFITVSIHGDPVEIDLRGSGQVITVIPTISSCDEAGEDYYCEGTNYDVVIEEGFQSADGVELNCTVSTPCSHSFVTSGDVDLTGPSISLLMPEDGDRVSSFSEIALQASAKDSTGVGTTDFSVDNVYVDSAAPSSCEGDGPMSCIANGEWLSGNLVPSSTHAIRATASDCSGNTATSSPVNVIALEAHCSNEVMDEDEVDIDCGGDDCPLCDGAECSEDEECASTECIDDRCVAFPQITRVSPGNGAVGNFITISGVGFGSSVGTVEFLGDPDIASDDVAASVVSCPTPSWLPTQIVVAVPSGAQTGAIRVTTFGEIRFSDTTDEGAPLIADFEVNEKVRPGLCGIAPAQSQAGERITISGVNFGTAPANGTVYFNGPSVYEAVFMPSLDTWIDSAISVLVPPSTAGNYDVSVFVSSEGSNSLDFSVMPSAVSAEAPRIDYVSSGVSLCAGDIEHDGNLCAVNADCGTTGVCKEMITTGDRGQYITIFGSGFGYSVGTVIFSDADAGDVVFVPDFPATCSNNWWNENEIVVKVPDSLSTAEEFNPKRMHVRTSSYPAVVQSNTVEFTVADIGVTPGLCAVSPSAGPENAAVTLYGDSLGEEAADFEVKFYNGSNSVPSVSANAATETYVSNQEIGARVPVGAVTGPMSVFVNGISSNTLNFQVGDCNDIPNLCSSSQTCCGNGSCENNVADCSVPPVAAQYVYGFTTGPIPTYPTVIEECSASRISPAPSTIWEDGSEACVNAAIQVAFSPGSPATRMNTETTGNPSYFFADKCVGTGIDPCESLQEDADGNPAHVIGVITASPNTATFVPTTALSANTWYLVTVTNDIENSNGVAMLEDYQFRFKTRADSAECLVEGVMVNPADYVAVSPAVIPYSAYPTTSMCQVLAPARYSYDWSLENYGKNIKFTGNAVSLPGIGYQVDVYPRQETNAAQPTLVTSRVVGYETFDTEDLTVDFTDPFVTSAIPQCSTACVNARVGASFNTAMNANGEAGILGSHSSSVGLEPNVRLFRCTNEFCEDFIGGPVLNPISFSNSYADEDDGREFFFMNPLAHSTYYRVMIWGGVTSESAPGDPVGVPLWGRVNSSGNPIAPLNYGNYYSWTFRTRNDSAACGIGSVNVEPDETFLNSVGERAGYSTTVFGQSDTCSLNGQELNPLAYQWSWLVRPLENPITEIQEFIATYLPDHSSTATLDTSSASVATCSLDCLNTGSLAYSAVCGDGVVTRAATGAGEDCDPASPSWSVVECSSDCQIVGITSCDSTVTEDCCGNGDREGREECDDGGNLNDDGCSSSCLNEGSAAAGLTCGDGVVSHSDVRGGEECDQLGNAISGDGCSSICLREGSVNISSINGVCGNGAIQDGEDCDDGNSNSGDGCSSTCLQEPLIGSWSRGSLNGVCGNLIVEPVVVSSTGIGEECDDGNTMNGDGCSAGCLNEGSSVFYSEPTFCGDGITNWSPFGGGEECEANESDGYPAYDPVQYMEIEPVAAQMVENGRVSTTIEAVCEDENTNTEAMDSAEIGLLCSCVADADCGNSEIRGCGTNDCCFMRPLVDEVNTRPLTTTTTTQCRNTLVSVGFDQEMDVDSLFSAETNPSPNVYLELIAEDKDKNGIYNPAIDGEPGSIECPSSYALYGGKPNFASGMFRKIVKLFWETAWAEETYCRMPANLVPTVIDIGTPTAPNLVTRVAVQYSQLLEPNGVYRLVVVRDNNTRDAVDVGVASVWGATMNGDSGNWARIFVTGSEICRVADVVVEDQSPSAGVFTEAGETHQLIANAYAMNGHVREMLQEVPGVYSWSWNGSDGPLSWGWASSIAEDNDADVLVETFVSENDSQSLASVTTADSAINGEESIIAQLRIDTSINAEIDVPGRIVAGAVDETVFLCENPWPAVANFPFADTVEFAATNTLGVTLHSPFTNFSFYYCRDYGDENNTSDDLPALNIVEKTAGIESEGVFKEFIFSVDSPDLNDAIGARVLANEEYRAPLSWFAEQGFVGTSSAEALDGFEGVRDGRTLYASAPNVDSLSSFKIYPNVYVVAYNEGANPLTVEIYERILNEWRFAANRTPEETEPTVTNHRICASQIAGGDIDPVEVDGDVVECTSNIDCEGIAVPNTSGMPADVFCDAEKDKLRRDYIRLGHMRGVGDALEEYGDSHGHCSVTKDQLCFADSDCSGDETCVASVPSLVSGTFIPSMTMSTWPSWQSQLANALGSALPTDPLNDYATCSEEGNYDPSTCYDALNAFATCPSDSHVYGYRSLGGESYELTADLEYGNAENALSWAYPIDTYSLGTIKIGNSTLPNPPFPSGLGGFEEAPNCADEVLFSSAQMCGDGNIGAGEFCEIGDTIDVPCSANICENATDLSFNGAECSLSADCGAGGSCVTTSGLKTVACYQPGEPAGGPGCTGYPSDSLSVCRPYFCGDGILDETLGEECDDGPLNGEYGFCGADCLEESGAFCGDGTLGGGEMCDCGYNSAYNSFANAAVCRAPASLGQPSYALLNGMYYANPNLGCAADCSGPQAYCGDGVITGNEECDGDSEQWGGRLCSDGTPCNVNSDCSSGTCGSAAVACPNTASGIPQVRTRSCLGVTRPVSDSCTWQTSSLPGGWGACQPTGSCGNGIKEGLEECDDGNDSENDSCLTTCESNSCGDGHRNTGVEACDLGGQNGWPCTPAYDGECTYCSPTCNFLTVSGAYCGDDEVNGGEYCDGSDVPGRCYKAMLNPDDRLLGGICTTDADCECSMPGELFCGSDYECEPLVGLCNGGISYDISGNIVNEYNGDYCVAGSNNVGDNCTTSGVCIAQNCDNNCATACPFTLNSGAVLAKSETSSVRTSEINLYSYLSGPSPDEATLYFPACTLGSRLLADVNTADILAPQIDVLFLIDMSTSMEDDVNGNDPAVTGNPSRVTIVEGGLETAVDTLYDAFPYGNMQIALATFSSGTTVPYGESRNIINNAGTQKSFTDSESDMLEAIDTRLTPTGNTPTADGLDWAYNVMSARANDPDASDRQRIVVLLTDGNPNYILHTSYSGVTPHPSGNADFDAFNVSQVLQSDLDVEVYTGAFTDSDVRIAKANHLSSNVCGFNFSNLADCAPSENGVNYAYNAETEDEFNGMISDIVNNIIGLNLNYLTPTGPDGGAIEGGNDVVLPFPPGFSCESNSTTGQPIPFEIPIFMSFNSNDPSSSAVNINNIRLEYCPFQ